MIFLIFILILITKIIIELNCLNLKITKKYILYNLIQGLSGLGLLYLYFKSLFNLSLFDIILIFISIVFLFHLCFYKQNIHESFNLKLKRKYFYIILIALLIGTLSEIFICNFHYFITYSNKPINVNLNEININKDEAIINNINQEIKNVYVNLNYTNNYLLHIDFSDEANEIFLETTSQEITNLIEKSKYLTIHPSGKVNDLRLVFSMNIKDKNMFNKIVLNPKVPLFFNTIRCLIITFIILFIYFLKSNSSLYKLNFKNFKQLKKLFVCLLIFNIIIFSILGNKALRSYKGNDVGIYNELVESFKKGRTYIVDENNTEKILNKLKNPYDTNKREKTFKNEKNYYLWDYAFYKGHYYVYFGVIPVILFYLPYNLITHSYLQTPFLIYLLTIMTILFISLLLFQLIRKYFSKCSIGVYILLDLLLVFAIGLEYFVKFPDKYSIPIVSALMFTFLGLNLWLGILKSNKFIKTKLLFGSLSMALVAGCRPQLLMGSFLLIPILIAYYKENKNKLKKKDYILSIAATIIPYLLVAVGLMYYNYIRFDSPFDFGANYNLTTNDMTKRGFKLARIPLGIMMYLFNPINFKNVFPYLVENNLSTNYLGLTIYESIFGGLIFTTLIYSLNLFLPKFKKIINSKLIYNSCLLMLISAFVILIFDTQAAGILARYLSDFSWLFAFPTVMIVLAIENKKFKYKEIFHKILFILIILALIYQFFYSFCSGYDVFKSNNISFWLYFKYLIEFWL